MLEAHLKSLCDQTKPKLRTQLTAALTTALTHLRTRITKGLLAVSSPSNLQAQIQHLQHSQLPYEEQLREHRLKEALRLQQELAERLTFVADTIHTLAPKPKEKPSRKQVQEAEDKKKQDSEEFAKKLMEQQKAIEQRRDKAMADLALQQMQWEAQEKQQVEEQAKAVAAEREKRVEQLRVKRLERERYLTQVKQRAHESPEPRAELSVLPEVELPKPAARLPISKEELEEHKKKYEELLKLGQERRRQRQLATASAPHLPISKSIQRLLHEEKKQREEADRQATQKFQILEKQRKYAQIVRTEHLPVIDKKKAAEVQAFKEPKKRSFSPEARLNVTLPPRPRFRAKPKPKEDPVEDPKPKPRDFLEEQRKAQLGHLSSALDRLQALDSSQLQQLPNDEKKAKAAVLEAQARRSEALLSRLNPADSAALQMEEGVNSLLLSSIKAKMTLLAA